MHKLIFALIAIKYNSVSYIFLSHFAPNTDKTSRVTKPAAHCEKASEILADAGGFGTTLAGFGLISSGFH